MYARLHAEEPGYRGIGASTAICPGIDFEADHKLGAPHWQALKEHWLASTRLLASEFLQGAARVAPLRRNTCTHCHLQALCRIGEQAQPADDDDAGNHDVD